MTLHRKNLPLLLVLLTAPLAIQAAPPTSATVHLSQQVLLSTCSLNMPATLAFGDHIARETTTSVAATSANAMWHGDALEQPWLTGCDSGEQVLVTMQTTTVANASGVNFRIGLAPDVGTVSSALSYRLTADSTGDAYPTHYSALTTGGGMVALTRVAPAAQLTASVADYNSLGGELSGTVTMNFTYE
jgi:hypothetical protein